MFCAKLCRMDSPKPARTCSVPGCDKKHYSRGLCRAHYARQARHGTPGAADIAPYGAQSCSVSGCDKPHMARGYCTTHYVRARKHGDPLTVKRGGATRTGGTWVGSQGYVYRYIGKEHPFANAAGATQEHRYVIAQELGRKLLVSENVHHINGDKTDNARSNLELWTRSQPAGQRVADKVAWALELLALYAPDKLAS